MNKEANNKVSCLDKKQINGPQLQFFFYFLSKTKKKYTIVSYLLLFFVFCVCTPSGERCHRYRLKFKRKECKRINGDGSNPPRKGSTFDIAFQNTLFQNIIWKLEFITKRSK